MMLSRAGKLGLYHRLLRAASLLPDSQTRELKLTEIRDGFRSSRDINDPREIFEKTRRAEKELAKFTSKLGNSNPENELDQQQNQQPKRSSGSRFFIVKDGKLTESMGTQRAVAPDSELGVTRDVLKRHEQLLRRQHFMDRD